MTKEFSMRKIVSTRFINKYINDSYIYTLVIFSISILAYLLFLPIAMVKLLSPVLNQLQFDDGDIKLSTRNNYDFDLNLLNHFIELSIVLLVIIIFTLGLLCYYHHKIPKYIRFQFIMKIIEFCILLYIYIGSWSIPYFSMVVWLDDNIDDLNNNVSNLVFYALLIFICVYAAIKVINKGMNYSIKYYDKD